MSVANSRPRKKATDEPRKLDVYRRKRAAGQTPEPFGGEGEARPGLFTIQKHAARRMHYDFRLEHEGILLSWAVPKQPSYDPDDKRLAVQTEDHPIEYANFEGVIPAGNYGAGGVIVWDRGAWDPIGDVAAGLQKGKLEFVLHGHKLRGEWTLVRTKAKGAETSKEWLLIKHRDAFAGKGQAIPDTSILSGRTVEDVAEGHDRRRTILAAIKRAKAPRGVDVESIEPMLAETRDEPFDDPAWLYELKYDGYRMFARRLGGKVELVYRGGGEVSALFPDLVTALEALPGDFVLDGELAVVDDEGRPRFHRLQQRTRLRRAIDIARGTVDHPASYFVFDLLAYDGHDLRPLPLGRRKQILRLLLPEVGPLRYVDHIDGEGRAFFELVRDNKLEGIMAKRRDAPYKAGRSDRWLKIPVALTGDFAVVGYAPSERRTLSGLYLATYDEGRWIYAGRVGNGFSDAELAALKREVDAHARKQPPIDPKGPQPDGKRHVWCTPRVVLEVRYKEETPEGLLRLPVFERVRPDKAPEDCVRQHAPAVAEPPPAAAPEPIPASARTVPFSNRDKIFFPEDGLTKGDLIDYYEGIAPLMLPYLADRPVVLTRYPDGIHGKSFFQKDAPGYVPPWLRLERMWSQHAEREIDYFICDDAPSLLYLVNLATIPVHVWASRVRTLPTPDWCILDLDPKGAPFADVITLARGIHALCDDLGLPSYPKTTGSTGLHVLVPVGRALTHDQSTTLGELLARVIVDRHPEIATIERVVNKRRGKVYVDFLQNGHGKTIVAPFSVRPLPKAPVSMPLRWSEVGGKLDPRQFTIRDARRRMDRLGEDPMRPVIDEAPRLDRALEKLSERLRR